MHDALGDLPDKEHFYHDSRFQQIVLASHRGYLGLVLDGHVEVHSYDEHRIHECLSIVPVLFRPVGAVRDVLVAGGGDGLAAMRLLGFADVSRVVICEMDDEVTALARREPLSVLNQDSLADDRVEVVAAPIEEHVADTDDTYDLIVCDLPAPRCRPREALFSRAFFAALAERLRPGGAIVTRVPFLPQTFASARQAMAATMPCVYPYRCTAQSIGTAGFLLGTPEPIARHRGVPGWCRFLNERVVPTLFALAKDELHFIARPVHTDAVAAWRADQGLPIDDDDAAPRSAAGRHDDEPDAEPDEWGGG